MWEDRAERWAGRAAVSLCAQRLVRLLAQPHDDTHLQHSTHSEVTDDEIASTLRLGRVVEGERRGRGRMRQPGSGERRSMTKACVLVLLLSCAVCVLYGAMRGAASEISTD